MEFNISRYLEAGIYSSTNSLANAALGAFVFAENKTLFKAPHGVATYCFVRSLAFYIALLSTDSVNLAFRLKQKEIPSTRMGVIRKEDIVAISAAWATGIFAGMKTASKMGSPIGGRTMALLEGLLVVDTLFTAPRNLMPSRYYEPEKLF